MGKAQKKTGKGRLDKYYKLAKEQGYRARSAFKLIQLNKKYSFLESARCCIDLCAAPGGWLQVASKYMPVNSVIVGVDLVPIKPIPRVVTFAADITTTHCRNLIRNELKDWKADVVLHDGAPNVGTAWVQDAYSQSELVLMSLKLAAQFLVKGGTFVTKVFRSVDYNNLIWVFNQLFTKVEATKPPSSRNVSAEIFVVCRDFLAPKHIDPKFFDPKHVFKELTATAAVDAAAVVKNAQANVFQPDKKRRQRDGYADGDYTLYKDSGAAEFIQCRDPIAFLGTYNKITFKNEEEKEWQKLDVTTSDVLANCEDLKVLGKGDFKALLKWRIALGEEIGLEVKTKRAEELTETVEAIEEVDEEEQIQDELERLNAEAAARAKRQRRRANEIKTRTIQRMQLRMTAPMDIGMEQADAALRGQDDMFELEEAGALKGKRSGAGYDDSSDEEGDSAEEEENDQVLDPEEERERKVAGLEGELDGLYDAYQEHLKERDAKHRVKEVRKNSKVGEEWHGIGKGDDLDSSDAEEGGYERVQRAKARIGENDSSDDDISDEEAIAESSRMVGKKRRQGNGPAESSSKNKKSRTVVEPEGPKTTASLSRSAQLWFDQNIFVGAHEDIEDDEEDVDKDGGDEDEAEADEDMEMSEENEEDGDEEAGWSDDDFEVVPQNQDDDVEMWDVDGEDEDEVKQAKIRKHGLVTAEAVTLAQALVNRHKTRTDLINDGFNRYSLNAKDGLPSWFLDDEQKYYKSNLPITKEAVAALRAKMRALDARPIKKVAEAKARKKLRAAQRLEKAMKKAEGVNETSDMTEREKAKQIEKLMERGVRAQKRKEVKVVVAKGVYRGLKGRPKGVKGKYVMVDARMKKEMRARKRKEKANKKRTRA